MVAKQTRWFTVSSGLKRNQNANYMHICNSKTTLLFCLQCRVYCNTINLQLCVYHSDILQTELSQRDEPLYKKKKKTHNEDHNIFGNLHSFIFFFFVMTISKASTAVKLTCCVFFFYQQLHVLKLSLLVNELT